MSFSMRTVVALLSFLSLGRGESSCDLADLAGHVDWPNTEVVIPIMAFDSCTNAKTIFIPKTVTEIEERAFFGAVSLSSVVFQEGSTLKIITGRVFKKCVSLTTISIPASVTEIGGGAFMEVSSLESVVFEGNSVTTIGMKAFANCESLTAIDLTSVLAIAEDAFLNGKCDKAIFVVGAVITECPTLATSNPTSKPILNPTSKPQKPTKTSTKKATNNPTKKATKRKRTKTSTKKTAKKTTRRPIRTLVPKPTTKSRKSKKASKKAAKKATKKSYPT